MAPPEIARLAGNAARLRREKQLSQASHATSRIDPQLFPNRTLYTRHACQNPPMSRPFLESGRLVVVGLLAEDSWAVGGFVSDLGAPGHLGTLERWIRVVTEFSGDADRVVTAFPQSDNPRQVGWPR
jgi:hypothetical protein